MANSGSNKVWSVVSLGTMHNRGSAVWEPTVPGAPTFVNPEGGETIYFTPSTDGGSEITNWYATISPDGPTLTLDTPDPANGGSVTISNYEWNTPYMLSVWAENEVGEGPPSTLPVEFVAVWNEATGGDVTIDHDYNDSGESWKIHTFTTANASEGFDVSVAEQPFRVLVVGGGTGGNGHGIGGGNGDPGGKGGHTTNTTTSLGVGSFPVTIGAGGRGGNASTSAYGAIKQTAGEAGTLSSIGGISTGTQASGGGNSSPGADGTLSDISGAALYYGGGGGGGGNTTGDGWSGTPGGTGGQGGGGNGAPGGGGNPGAGNGTNQRGGGGGGGGGNNGTGSIGAQGGKGGSGIVIVAYRIG